MTKLFPFFLFAVVLTSIPASADPRDQLNGYWRFRRGVGGPCASQIRSLSYYFGRDGTYRSEAEMTPGGRFKYSGRFVADDKTATAYVDGQTIGPIPYRIENGILKIEQKEFRCWVELEREDF